MRATIEVIMQDVDFGKNTITVKVKKWGSVGAGKYMLVPVEETILSDREETDD